MVNPFSDGEESDVIATNNWNPEWDKKGWEEIAESLKAKGVKSSSVIVQPGSAGDEDGPISRRLKTLCQSVSVTGAPGCPRLKD